MSEFNPEFEIGHSGVKMTLTAICHDAGIRGRKARSDNDGYFAAYYATMRRLAPDHPALAMYDAEQAA